MAVDRETAAPYLTPMKKSAAPLKTAAKNEYTRLQLKTLGP